MPCSCLMAGEFVVLCLEFMVQFAPSSASVISKSKEQTRCCPCLSKFGPGLLLMQESSQVSAYLSERLSARHETAMLKWGETLLFLPFLSAIALSGMNGGLQSLNILKDSSAVKRGIFFFSLYRSVKVAPN